MFKGLCLLTSLVLVTSLVLNIDLVSAANKEPHEYNLYFNDTSYQDSYVHSSKQGDFYFQAYYHPFSFNKTISFLEYLSDSDLLSHQCRTSLKRWTKGIEAGEIWAIKLLESTGRTVNGKLTGN